MALGRTPVRVVEEAGAATGLGTASLYTLLPQMFAGSEVPGLTGAQTVAYQYDVAGNRTRITWPDAYYVQYQYDALSRMTTANENGTYLLAS